MKFGQKGELLDIGIGGARVVQEAPPQLEDDLVVNHDDVLSGKKRTAQAHLLGGTRAAGDPPIRRCRGAETATDT